MQVNATFKAADRAAWRLWLEQNHGTASEIWLLYDDRPEVPTLTYLDSVEEAICFGWIDSIQKRFSSYERAQRFSPRKPRGKWTELNKARARRLLRLGLMTEAGQATLPDLDAPFTIAEDIATALKAEPDAWENFLAFPELYRRVRIGYIEDARKNKDEFDRRLSNFTSKTARNQMFGNWNDGGRLE
jgi:uncharacterized protein YdeI (YjbR/CyaY-like superfamily)